MKLPFQLAMLSQRRRRAIRLVKFLLGAVLIVVLGSAVDGQQLLEIFKSARKGWVLVVVLATIALTIYQGLLLGYVASPFAHVPIKKLTAFTLIGRFFSLFMPSSVGGDLIKGVYLLPYFPRPAKVYAAIFMHRFLGGLSTLVVALAACLLFLPTDLKTPIAVLAGMLVICAIAGALTWRRYNIYIEKWLVRHREKHLESFVFRTCYSLLGSLSTYRRVPWVLARGFLLSMAGSLLLAGLYILIAYALRLPLSFPQALVASSATMLTVLIPLTPGGVGVSEVAFVVIAKAMDVQPDHALSIVLFGRATGYVSALPGGILYMLLPTCLSGVHEQTRSDAQH